MHARRLAPLFMCLGALALVVLFPTTAHAWTPGTQIDSERSAMRRGFR